MGVFHARVIPVIIYRFYYSDDHLLLLLLTTIPCFFSAVKRIRVQIL